MTKPLRVPAGHFFYRLEDETIPLSRTLVPFEIAKHDEAITITVGFSKILSDECLRATTLDFRSKDSETGQVSKHIAHLSEEELMRYAPGMLHFLNGYVIRKELREQMLTMFLGDDFERSVNITFSTNLALLYTSDSSIYESLWHATGDITDADIANLMILCVPRELQNQSSHMRMQLAGEARHLLNHVTGHHMADFFSDRPFRLTPKMPS